MSAETPQTAPSPPPPPLTEAMVHAATVAMTLSGLVPGCRTDMPEGRRVVYRGLVADIWAAMHTASLVDSPAVDDDRWTRKHVPWSPRELAVLERHARAGDVSTREWGTRELPGRSMTAIRSRYLLVREGLSDTTSTAVLCESCRRHFVPRDPQSRCCMACRVSGRARGV